MTGLEYDVYLCTTDPRSPVATAVAAGLRRLGFRVYVPGRDAGRLRDSRDVDRIESISDFVVVTAASDGGGEAGQPWALDPEIRQAQVTGRTLIWVAEQHGPERRPTRPSPLLEGLRPWQYVPYEPLRSREAVAILSHRLLSSQEVDDRQVMRRAKQLTAVAGVALLVVVGALAIPPILRAWNRPKPPPPVPPFELHWAGFGQRVEGGRWSTFPLKNGTTLQPGDRIRLAFSPGSDGYAFVMATDTRGDVRVLYPPARLRGLASVKAGQIYGAPDGADWLAVETEGEVSALFVIGSYDSLENLEEVAEQLEGEGSSKSRVDLLTLTVDGLVDGRHAVVRPPVWTRKGQVVDQNLSGTRPSADAVATLVDGTRLTSPFTSQRGLVGASVELRFRYAQPGTVSSGVSGR